MTPYISTWGVRCELCHWWQPDAHTRRCVPKHIRPLDHCGYLDPISDAGQPSTMSGTRTVADGGTTVPSQSTTYDTRRRLTRSDCHLWEIWPRCCLNSQGWRVRGRACLSCGSYRSEMSSEGPGWKFAATATGLAASHPALRCTDGRAPSRFGSCSASTRPVSSA